MPRASPAARVSLFAVAARHVVCKEEHRRSPPSNMCRSAMAVENMYGWTATRRRRKKRGYIESGRNIASTAYVQVTWKK